MCNPYKQKRCSMSDNYIIFEFYVAYQFKEKRNSVYRKKLFQENVKQKKIQQFFFRKTFIRRNRNSFSFFIKKNVRSKLRKSRRWGGWSEKGMSIFDVTRLRQICIISKSALRMKTTWFDAMRTCTCKHSRVIRNSFAEEMFLVTCQTFRLLFMTKNLIKLHKV